MNSEIVLRDVEDSDLPIFFERQLDPDANWMAAFTAKDPADRDAFMAHLARIRSDPANVIQTILYDGRVAGSVSSYQEEPGKPEVDATLSHEIYVETLRERLLDVVEETMRPTHVSLWLRPLPLERQPGA